MTKEERAIFTKERKDAALQEVKSGKFPPAVRVKLGEHTLYAMPSGVSEKGNVSYSIRATTINVGGRQVRINNLNVSVLEHGAASMEMPAFKEDECL